MFVQITAPGPGTPEVPRAFTVAGSISVQLSSGHGPLVSKSVSVQFGVDSDELELHRRAGGQRAAGRHHHAYGDGERLGAVFPRARRA
jgi:hypothetical protein